MVSEVELESVVLVAEDGKQFHVSRRCAELIGILQPILSFSQGQANAEPASFNIASVKSPVLSKVVEYLEQHCEDPSLPCKSANCAELNTDSAADVAYDSDVEDELKVDDEEHLYAQYIANVTPWDQRFLEALELSSLIELTKAANYLNIPGLLDLCCRTIAQQMSGLRVDELRRKFNLTNDFSPEEEARMVAEFSWVQE